MASYRKKRKRRFNKSKFVINLFLMLLLVSIVFVSGKLIIKMTYAALETIGNADESDDFLILVNREHNIPEDYIPDDLTEVNIRFAVGTEREQKMMKAVAAKALEELFKEAEKENIILYGVSGYRSYEYQKQLYERKVKAVGKEEADKYVAAPGQSEHHTGLAMDVMNESAVSVLTESFAETREGKWLAENAHRFGFIIRYPKGKESITGYNYEPWHIRYVGVEAATEIKTRGIVLEEYLQGISDNAYND